MARSKAAVLEDVERITVRDFDLPDVGPDDALLKVEIVGVCGTDYKYYHGKLAAPYPIILGHEILGWIEAVGERAAERYKVKAGDRVMVEGSIPCWACKFCLNGNYRFCVRSQNYGTRISTNVAPSLWGAMAQYMYLAPGSVVHRIAHSIPQRVAIMAGLLANGIQWAHKRGGLSIGQTIVIQGAGPQGLAAATMARECGAGKIIITGLSSDEARLRLARELGADYTLVADREDVAARVREITGGEMADVVLEVTGSPRAIQTSVELLHPTGTLVLAGLTGKETETSLRLDQLVWNEIKVQGVYTKGDEAISAAVKFMETRGDRYPLDQVVSHVYSLDETEKAIRAAGGEGGPEFIKAAIVP